MHSNTEVQVARSRSQGNFELLSHSFHGQDNFVGKMYQSRGVILAGLWDTRGGYVAITNRFDFENRSFLENQFLCESFLLVLYIRSAVIHSPWQVDQID